MKRRLDRVSPGMRYVQVGEQLPNFEHVDWSLAPRPFKLYRESEHIDLSSEGFFSDESLVQEAQQQDAPGTLRFEQCSQMLSDMYGFTRVRSTVEELSVLSLRESEWKGWQTILRPVPSGGALFPCELYLVVGQNQCLPAGVYHYDAVHHALDIVHREDVSSALNASLTSQQGQASQFMLIASCLFWRTGFKYGTFSYRLHSLDLGVVVAQILLVAGRYGLSGQVHYRFLDEEINQLLGLNGFDESAYAVITLPVRGQPARDGLLEFSPQMKGSRKGGTLLEEQEVPIERWPLLAELHDSSLIRTRATLHDQSAHMSPTASSFQRGAPTTCLLSEGEEKLDLLNSLKRRHSALGYFQFTELSQRQLSLLLRECMREYLSDIAGSLPDCPHFQLYCVVNAVSEMAPGIYGYDVERHMLTLLRKADMRAELQVAHGGITHNMFQVSLCLHLVANYEDGFAAYGDRWYRMLNMEAGMGLQRLSLTAAALNLGCQISLIYDVERINTLLQLPPGFTCLAQALIAPESPAGQYYEQAF